MATEKTTTQKGKEEKKKLEMRWTPRPFETVGNAVTKQLVVGSDELSRLIGDQFRVTFHECAGFNISFSDRFDCRIAFERQADQPANGKRLSLIDYATRNDDSGKHERRNFYVERNYREKQLSGRRYELNQETKELLDKFMYRAHPKDKIPWNNLISERPRMYTEGNQNIYGFNSYNEHIYLEVRGLDIRKILKEFFGYTIMVTDADGNDSNAPADYMIRYDKPFKDGSGRFWIKIEQVDINALNKIYNLQNPHMMYAHQRGMSGYYY